MDTQLFEGLKDSLRQAKAIRQGKLEGRRTTVAPTDSKAAQKQAKFSNPRRLAPKKPQDPPKPA